jgi:hypothetical protein
MKDHKYLGHFSKAKYLDRGHNDVVSPDLLAQLGLSSNATKAMSADQAVPPPASGGVVNAPIIADDQAMKAKQAKLP